MENHTRKPSLFENPSIDLMHQHSTHDQRTSELIQQQDVKKFFTPLSSYSINVTDEDRSHFEVQENINWDELHDVTHLADGGMCRVYTAYFKGIECVVKTPLPEDTVPDPVERADIKRSLQDELEVLRRIKHHPNIIAYYGSGTRQNGDVFILMEKLEGTLDKVLEKRQIKKQLVPVSLLDAVKWGAELAQAMAYLNDKAVDNAMVLHRDLKPENIGFGADGNLKVIDLGLSIICERHFRSRSDHYRMSGGVGSLRYMAHEIAQNLPYNEKADVHSFGMIFWEMLSGVPPYQHYDADQYFHHVVGLGKRPPLNKKWSLDIKNLLKTCWAQDEDVRPAFREIIGHMEGILMDEIQNATAQTVESKGTFAQFKSKLKSVFGCNSSLVIESTVSQNITSVSSEHSSDGSMHSSPPTPHFHLSHIDDKIRERLAEDDHTLPSESVIVKVDGEN